MKRFDALAGTLCAVTLCACTAAVSGTAGPGSSGAVGSAGSAGTGPVATGNAGSGAVGMMPAPSKELCATSVDPGPAVVRRVTRLEYNNTVSDLLGTPTTIANQFPTEEVAFGFNNNAAALTVSPELAEQYLDSAETLAKAAVTTNLTKIATCDPTVMAADACAAQFISAFGQRAYRRPLTPADTTLLTGVFNAGKATDFATGVRFVIETVLQSPQFLYRVEFGTTPSASTPTVAVTDGSSPNPSQIVPLDNWEMASRLSYLIWASMPDDQLFAAAAAGKLSAPADIQAQAQRLLADPKAHARVADFHNQWLGLSAVATLEKDATIFPSFSPTIAGYMLQETQAFLDDVVWQEKGSLATIFTAPFTFVNGPLAQYYGMAGVTGNAFVKAPLDPAQRAGLLTQGAIVSKLAKTNQTSPVLRGKFVREQLLCFTMPPPPVGVSIKVPDLSPTLTTRQRFSMHSVDPACSACHSLMDPIGLGFEGFDAAGAYRATENGVAVDVSGSVNGAVDTQLAGAFNGIVDLEKKLGESSTVQQCVTTQWFRYAYGRKETTGDDADACSMAALQTQFAAGGYKVQDLLAALTQTKPFLYRRVTPATGTGGMQ
jgi:hypothetical protein